jgi:hypothetical protein
MTKQVMFTFVRNHSSGLIKSIMFSGCLVEKKRLFSFVWLARTLPSAAAFRFLIGPLDLHRPGQIRGDNFTKSASSLRDS